MIGMKDLVQNGDFKHEKHIPSIDIAKDKTNAMFKIEVRVGKEIEHPNTTEHHIVWIDLYFLPEKEAFVKHLGRINFGAHGGSAQGPNTSGMFSVPSGEYRLKTTKNGALVAISYCNVHGLWQSSAELKL